MCNSNRRKGDADDNETLTALESTRASSGHHDDLDKYVESFDKILGTVGTLGNQIFDVSLDAGRDLNHKAKEWSYNWFNGSRLNGEVDDGRIDNDKEAGDLGKEYRFDGFKFPPFYETRDVDLKRDDIIGPIFNEFWKSNPFFQDVSLKFIGTTPFGYRAFKGPSIRQYHNCLDKQGKSIWDEQGYWRCLFPESEVPVRLLDYKKQHLGDAILTKEDFFNHMNQLGENEEKPVIDLKEQGKWFNRFEDYLGWKRVAYQEAQKKRELELKARQEAREKALLNLRRNDSNGGAVGGATTTTTGGGNSPELASLQERYVTSSSIKSNMFTDPETNEIKLIESKKECFNDGNCLVTKITKLKPVGSAQWATVEEHTEDLKDNKGWFWK